MTHIITGQCRRDQACIEVCPVDCIVPGSPPQKWPTSYVDPDTCIDCGACVPECPNSAIYAEEEIPRRFVADIRKNYDFFRGGPGYQATSVFKTPTPQVSSKPASSPSFLPKIRQFTTSSGPEDLPIPSTSRETSNFSWLNTQSPAKPAQKAPTPAPRPQGSIFISYKREDWNQYVLPLVNYLNGRGFTVWVDQHLIEGGKDWQDEINAALRTCTAMILCVTSKALQSKYIKTEYRYFYNNNKYLIPLLCEKTRLPPELEGIQCLPYGDFDTLQRLLRRQLTR